MDTVTKICTAAIIIVSLIGDFVLAWHGTLSGGEALGFAAAVVGLPVAGAATTTTVKAALKANPPQ